MDQNKPDFTAGKLLKALILNSLQRIEKASSSQSVDYESWTLGPNIIYLGRLSDTVESSPQRHLGPEQAILVALRLRFVLNMFDYDEFTALEFINRLG